MMSSVIQKETMVFFLSVLYGSGILFFYDLLRSVRRVFRHGLAAVFAEDFLFCLVVGFLIFLFSFFETEGVIRGYLAVGMVIGAVLYHLTLSPWVLRLLSTLLGAVRKLFAKSMRLFLGGVRKGAQFLKKVVQILSIPVKKSCIKLNKIIEIRRKKGYNVTKGKYHGSRRSNRRDSNHVCEKKKKARQK